jgi:hypothetical protein
LKLFIAHESAFVYFTYMNESENQNKKVSAPETRIVIDYGDKPYVVTQGDREIRRFARVDEAQQFATASAPETRNKTPRFASGAINRDFEAQNRYDREVAEASKASAPETRTPANWHDCEVAEKQILELQRERDELRGKALKLADKCDELLAALKLTLNQLEFAAPASEWKVRAIVFPAIKEARAAIAKAEGRK